MLPSSTLNNKNNSINLKMQSRYREVLQFINNKNIKADIQGIDFDVIVSG